MGENESDALAFDEFGVAVVQAGQTQSFNQPFGFTGYQTDEVSELYYAQARYYEPDLGRFTAQDTHWNPNNMILGDIPGNYHMPDMDAIIQSANLYAYCGNNPIVFYDSVGSNRQRTASERTPSSNPRANKPSGSTPSMTGLQNDLNNFNLFNKEVQAVKDATYISAYKGKLVIIHDLPWLGERAGAFGAVFLPKGLLDLPDDQLEALLKHESGHLMHMSALGPAIYALGIFIPSALNENHPNYYSQPWEIIADIFGGVNRGNYSSSAGLYGWMYYLGLEIASSIGAMAGGAAAKTANAQFEKLLGLLSFLLQDSTKD